MLDQLLIVVSLSVLIIVSPGPDMVIVMRNTLTGGRSAGLVTSLGVLTGNLVHVTYCVLGIGWLVMLTASVRLRLGTPQTSRFSISHTPETWGCTTRHLPRSSRVQHRPVTVSWVVTPP